MDRRDAATRPGPAKGKPGGSKKKISRGLVTLSAAAIITIYGAGYVRTQDAAARVAAQATQVGSVGQGSSGLTNTPTSRFLTPTVPLPVLTSQVGSVSQGSVGLTNTPTPTVQASQASQSTQYRDGTYTGVGTSRHGSIQARIVVQGGRIVSAAISQATTRYPTSRISRLPQAVVSQQSTNVNMVSGATDSSNAYLDAVDNALAQAV